MAVTSVNREVVRALPGGPKTINDHCRVPNEAF
jgi:hypothetical protein